MMRREFRAGVEERNGAHLQARCGRSRYGCAAAFSVLRDQQEDAGQYERRERELKALLKGKTLENAWRSLDALVKYRLLRPGQRAVPHRNWI